MAKTIKNDCFSQVVEFPVTLRLPFLGSCILHLSRKDRGEEWTDDDPLPLVFLESPAQIVTKKCVVRLVASLSEPREREKERKRERERERVALCGEHGQVVLTRTTNSGNGAGGRKQILLLSSHRPRREVLRVG